MADNSDVTLEYNGQKYDLFLENGVKSIQESSAEESTFNARFARGKKKYGEDPLLTLAEFRDWTGGRGGKNFEDDATAYADGLAWTLSSGMVVPVPRWQIATGLRSESRYMPGDVTWRALLDSYEYISIPFSTTSGYDAKNIWLFVRRVGSPGDLTVSLCADNGGIPAAVATQTVVKDIDDITDYIDVFECFAMDSTVTLVANTIYHIKIYGSQQDNGDNHWEIGVDRANGGSFSSSDGISWNTGDLGQSGTGVNDKFKIYYRVTATDVSLKFLFQTYSGNVYAVTRPAAGASSFYLFDNTSAFAAAGGGAVGGSTPVTGRPCLAGSYMYFPIGEAQKIRRWDLTSTWIDDASNAMATQLLNFNDVTNGPQLVKVNASTIALSNVGATLSFGTAIKCGDTSYPITNVLSHIGKLHVFLQNEIGIVSSGAYSPQDSNLKFTPSARNGAGVCSWNGLLYYSWLNTVMESYSGNANDVGQSWRGQGPTSNRAGYASCILGINAWRFVAYDAGATGYSSVQVYNGMTWHEIYRAPYGHRIRDMWWQHVDGGHSRLFIDIDYDVVYLEFAKDVATPTKDSTYNYAHSFYIVSPTFDDGAARLPKYIKTITISGTNCGQIQDTSVWFEVDYQADNDVGLDTADNWHLAGKVFTSPEGTIKLNMGNKRAIRVRVRGYTDTSTVPPQLDAITLDGFTRTPARTIWTLKVKIGTGAVYKKKASELLKFLQEASTSASDIIITSSVPELNGRHVISTRPKVSRDILTKLSGAWSGTMVLSFMDMSE